MNFRVGNGFDIHRFTPQRRLVLGGETLPNAPGLLGHSDADVLCHAVIDALLGATADRDIGFHFPDTDPQWKDASSLDLLRSVCVRIAGNGWSIGNIDVTLLAETPRIAPHVPAMRANLAHAMNVAVDSISIKATTLETLGALGRREGIAAMAVALVERNTA